MSKDILPYENNILDTIYCSYVVEHVETKHVIKFISESFKTLKKKSFTNSMSICLILVL